MPAGAFYGQEGAFWDQEGAAVRAREGRKMVIHTKVGTELPWRLSRC